MTGTWYWWMFVNEHERNLFWSNISTNTIIINRYHILIIKKKPTVRGSIDRFRKKGPAWTVQAVRWSRVRIVNRWEFKVKDKHPELGSFRMWNSKEWNYSNVYSNLWCWILTPSHRMYLFEMNRNKPELHEGVKWKKSRTPQRVKSNTINYAW